MNQDDPYETTRVLREYLLFHYGSEREILSLGIGPRDALGFCLRTVDLLLDADSLRQKDRALDLGCAVGGSSFVLAKTFGEVIGIDKSHALIEAAKVLRKDGELTYESRRQGAFMDTLQARVDPGVDRSRIRFQVADACELDSSLGPFDVVHAANLLCRLPDPRALLSQLPDLVRPGGQLLLATPFTWLDEFTPSCNWLGKGGEDSFQDLKLMISNDFELQFEIDIPFLIREHERKFQYGISLGTRWRRKR